MTGRAQDGVPDIVRNAIESAFSAADLDTRGSWVVTRDAWWDIQSGQSWGYAKAFDTAGGHPLSFGQCGVSFWYWHESLPENVWRERHQNDVIPWQAYPELPNALIHDPGSTFCHIAFWINPHLTCQVGVNGYRRSGDPYEKGPTKDDRAEAERLAHIVWRRLQRNLTGIDTPGHPIPPSTTEGPTPLESDQFPGDEKTRDLGDSREIVTGESDPNDEISPAITALGSLAVGGLTALGAGLMMLGTGVTPRDVVEGLRDWVSGTSSNPDPATPALDPFESWKRDHESRGWRYSEVDGTARFDPVEGSLDERGWTYSESQGAFHPPQGGHEPPPLPDSSELRYREEVRLLQEDFQRQRELLDRERQRLTHYQDAGLDELLAGTRERIREHEKLADLSRAELVRLNEDLPAQTVQDHRDLEAEAAARRRSRDLIQDLNESDRKLEAGGEAIAEGDREIRQLEEEDLMREKMTELEERMQSTINEKIREGYYVRNSNLFKKAWNNTLGWAVEKAGGWKGGQCGEFGQWGADWSKKDVQEIFGENAIVTDIAASNNPFLGHRATKVILPDGSRKVLDFWESLPGGKPKIYDEDKWIERWNDKLWGNALGEVSINRHEDELNLKGLIDDWGEEAGKEKFRLYNAKKKGRDYAETFIRSWEKKPW